MKKTMIFILCISTISQITKCVTRLQAMKMSYKNVIYDSSEAKHYLEKIIMPSNQINNLTSLKKSYEESLNNTNLVLYYQNQYFRSELYNLAQSKKMSPEEIKPFLNQIDKRIDSLVEKYAEKINEFEKTYSYFGSDDDTHMKKLARS